MTFNYVMVMFSYFYYYNVARDIRTYYIYRPFDACVDNYRFTKQRVRSAVTALLCACCMAKRRFITKIPASMDLVQNNTTKNQSRNNFNKTSQINPSLQTS